MNTCDTCKWWEDFKQRLAAGACNNPKLTAFKVDPDGLHTGGSDDDGYRPNTGPKFGCIHHEPK